MHDIIQGVSTLLPGSEKFMGEFGDHPLDMWFSSNQLVTRLEQCSGAFYSKSKLYIKM